jgi:hypothetical protein
LGLHQSGSNEHCGDDDEILDVLRVHGLAPYVDH